MAKLGLNFNTVSKALTQYQGYDFDDMTMFGDIPIGINNNGIFELFKGGVDNLYNIEATIELPRNSFQTSRNKRLRKMYIAGQLNNTLQIKVMDDQENVTFYNAVPSKPGKQHITLVACGRNYNKGIYYTIQLSNINGNYFNLDFIQLLIVMINRKPEDM